MAETGVFISEKEDPGNFCTRWNNYKLFEAFQRQKGEILSQFLTQWKIKMIAAQTVGCQYSNTLLALKLLEKANLENDDIQCIVSSMKDNDTDILSIMLARLEAFKPEESEREESHGRYKEENFHLLDVKQESTEKFPPSESDKAFPSLKSSRLNGTPAMSKCPHCDSSQGLLLVETDGNDESNLFCQSCCKTMPLSLITAQESSNEVQDQEDDMSDMIPDIKEEPVDTPLSLLDIDITDMVDLEKKPKAKVNGLKDAKKKIKTKKIPKVPKPRIRSQYEEAAIHSCTVCGKKYDRIPRVISHMSIKHKVDSTQLAEYEKKLRNRPKKKRTKREFQDDDMDPDWSAEMDEDSQIKSEDDKEKFQSSQCEFCGNYFFQKGMQNHYKHCKSMLQASSPSQEDGNDSQEASAGIHRSQCEFCGDYFFQKGLQNHYKHCKSVVHPIDSKEKEPKEKRDPARKKAERLQCEFCGKEYPIIARLKEHYAGCPNLDQEQREGYIRPYKRKLPCNICGKIYAGVNNLRLHMTTHGEKNYKCDICDATFPNPQYLGFHKKRHNRPKPHKCSYCGKSFADKTLLKRHIMQIHTNERPFHCDQCSYKAINKYHLDRHVMKHSGERPFKCGLCDKPYRFKKSVKAHIRTQHKQDDFTGIIIRISSSTNKLPPSDPQ